MVFVLLERAAGPGNRSRPTAGVGVSAKIGSEGRGQQLGTRVGTAWILSQALGSAKDKKYVLKSLDGCIVSGCWGLKRKFQIIAAA